MLRVRLSRLVAFVARAKARRANEAATLIQEAGLTMVLARRCGESTIVVQKYARRFLQRQAYLIALTTITAVQATGRRTSTARTWQSQRRTDAANGSARAGRFHQ